MKFNLIDSGYNVHWGGREVSHRQHEAKFNVRINDKRCKIIFCLITDRSLFVHATNSCINFNPVILISKSIVTILLLSSQVCVNASFIASQHVINLPHCSNKYVTETTLNQWLQSFCFHYQKVTDHD